MIKDKGMIRMIKIKKMSLRSRNIKEALLAEWALNHQTSSSGTAKGDTAQRSVALQASDNEASAAISMRMEKRWG